MVLIGSQIMQSNWIVHNKRQAILYKVRHFKLNLLVYCKQITQNQLPWY